MKKGLALLLGLLLALGGAALAEGADATSSASPQVVTDDTEAVSTTGGADTASSVTVEASPVEQAPDVQLYTCDGLFSFEVPQGMWLDTTGYEDDFEVGQEWRFMVYNTESVIDAARISTMGHYKGMSLATMTEEEVSDYVETYLDQNMDIDAEPLETFLNTDGNIRFALFVVRDSQGAYYEAETLINGEVYGFNGYCYDMSDAGERELTVLRTFLSSLKLVKPL